jgi:hypothetical protein
MMTRKNRSLWKRYGGTIKLAKEHSNTVIQLEYIHSQPYDDEFSDLWDEDAPQQRVIHYMLYEEEVKVEVDKDTGEYRYLAFAGIDLKVPTEVKKWVRVVFKQTAAAVSSISATYESNEAILDSDGSVMGVRFNVADIGEERTVDLEIPNHNIAYIMYADIPS